VKNLNWTDTAFSLIPFIQPDTTNLMNNPLLSYYMQLAQMAEQEIRLAKSAYLPDIVFGYTNQQIEELKV